VREIKNARFSSPSRRQPLCNSLRSPVSGTAAKFTPIRCRHPFARSIQILRTRFYRWRRSSASSYNPITGSYRSPTAVARPIFRFTRAIYDDVMAMRSIIESMTVVDKLFLLLSIVLILTIIVFY